MATNLPHVNTFRDLIVYQKSRQLAQEIFRLTKTFPKEELYSLTDQIRRSSRSVGGQIAEAWAKRRYEAHFISKLTDGDGEQQETQHWIDIATGCGYWDASKANDLQQKCEEIGRLINGMIGKSNMFCGTPSHPLRESPTDYFTNNDYNQWFLSMNDSMS